MIGVQKREPGHYLNSIKLGDGIKAPIFVQNYHFYDSFNVSCIQGSERCTGSQDALEVLRVPSRSRFGGELWISSL